MKIQFITLLFIISIHGQLFSATFTEISENSYTDENVCLFSDSSYNDVFISIDSVNLAILQPSSGIQFYQDGIVFLSHTKQERKMINKHLSFGTVDAYYAIPGENISTNHIVFSPTAVFSYPCEAITFSNDFVTMFYTKKSKTDGKEKIFEAKNIGKKDQAKWIYNPEPLEFCQSNYIYTHPALSNDGGFLIFASDMTGSFGGMDLFISYRGDNGWSVPKNLGQTINTGGNELFPQLDPDNNLFFSSDGLPGYGGYDIFLSKCNGIYWDTLINLAGNINSAKNDLAFTINRKDGKTAYFTTKGNLPKGDMQLYKLGFDRIHEEKDSLILSNVLFNNALMANDFPLIVNLYPVAIRPTKDTIHEVITEYIKEDSIIVPTLAIVPETAEREIAIPEEIMPESIPQFIPEVTDNKPAKQLKETSSLEPKNEIEQVVPDLNFRESEVSDEVINNDLVVYKIQFLSSNKSLGNFQIKINGKTYDAKEYYYKNEYRYTICEFNSLEFARELQHACRQAGYRQAFVAAFKNDVRSLDTSLFTR